MPTTAVWHCGSYPADEALARWATEIVPAVREAITGRIQAGRLDSPI